MLENVKQFFLEYGEYFIYAIICLIVLGIFIFTFKLATLKRKEREKTIRLVKGTSDFFKVSEENAKKKEQKKAMKREKRKRKNPFYQLYFQYLYFGGTKKKFWLITICGWLACVMLYLLVTGFNIIVSIISSILYFAILYTITELKMRKKRMSYIKGFVSALDSMTSSIFAGNSFEEAIANISQKKTIFAPIRHEFEIINNNLKSGIPLNEALDDFAKRNYLFEEFSMFSIVMQFYIKSGGRNMKNIFNSLQKTLNQRLENYSTISSSIFQYQMAYTAFFVVEIGATVLVPFFSPGFYTVVSSSLMGYGMYFGSIALTLLATFLFNNSIRKAAEG